MGHYFLDTQYLSINVTIYLSIYQNYYLLSVQEVKMDKTSWTWCFVERENVFQQIYVFFLKRIFKVAYKRWTSSGSPFIRITILYTVCPGSSDPFYIVSYYIKRVFLDIWYFFSVFPRSLDPSYTVSYK